MKKITILLFLIVINQSTIYADEIDSLPEGSYDSLPEGSYESKLKRIQNKIDKYTKLINDLPRELQEKIDNFNRLKRVGNKIQEVLTIYLVATKECLKESHSKLGKEACDDLSSLDLGMEIKKKKEEVLAMINEASRELEDVKKKQKDIPLIKKVLETLRETKRIMMNDL
jgi:prefoldin subunit 5